MLKLLLFSVLLGNAAMAAAEIRTQEVSYSGGGVEKSRGIQSRPLTSRNATSSTGKLFERLDAARQGIGFAHRWTPAPEQEREIVNGLVGGGVAIGDYDGDDLPDIYLTRPHGGGRLYRNLGGFRFEDVTELAGLGGQLDWGTGVAFVDIDNDGDLDLYVCGHRVPNRLYVNQGDGSFTEEAAALGLDFSGASVIMAFADYDLDGDLDGYLLTNRIFPEPGTTFTPSYRNGRWQMPDNEKEVMDLLVTPAGLVTSIVAGQYDRLYRQGDDGTFSDVSQSANISGNQLGLSATWWDYNGDLLPDLYVANDFWGADKLYRNNGDGSFTDVARETLPHTPWYSMGADAADINNDGRIDFMASDMAGTTHYRAKLGMGEMQEQLWFLEYAEPRQYMRNALYLNTGTDRLMEVAYLTGLTSTDWTWSIKFGDLDNDGWVDLFVSNGMTRDFFNSDLRKQVLHSKDGPAPSPGEAYTAQVLARWLETPPKKDRDMAFRNLGSLSFKNVGSEWGLDYEGVSFGAAAGDLDGDGDLDLVVNHFDEPVGLYRNTETSSSRVLLRLEGRSSNRWGIGSKVTIQTASGTQTRYLKVSSGFMSSNDPNIHFGLGKDELIARLTVRWPSGQVQVFEDLLANRHYTVSEPSDGSSQPSNTEARAPQFTRSHALELIQHLEQPFDDYAEQPLLPQKLSQLGPGLAFGDADGDGDDDIFVGGAAGQAGMLYLNGGDGSFSWGPLEPFSQDSAHEDMAPLFFDADGDNDMDLYVASGGVEYGPGSAELEDRLYLNDGRGGFEKAPDGSLPERHHSSSCVVAADFDRDGDLDLFIGARSVPGSYPVTPESRLLRNDSGSFSDVTDEYAPGLRQTGLVTSAVWSDADGDGWLDLLVTHEWGPVKLYRNHQGRLVDQTEAAGLAGFLGWWNGIAARDVDGDGDIDYAVMNNGLNTKYGSPSEAEPSVLFFGDVDDSGKMNLVEATTHSEELLPVRGLSCSSSAMPFMRDEFPTFSSFASAVVDDIYDPERLANSLQLRANHLESGLLLNDGMGRFEWSALPRLAQASPGFGVVLTEIDGDGKTDLYFVQNYLSREPETGHLDGGLSLLLLGQGDGQFRPIWPSESGLVIPGDAKGLAAVDLNGDSWVDFVVGLNDAELLAFENKASHANRMLELRLAGPTGNPTAVGARVTVQLDDGSSQTAEVLAGGSYMSQSSSALAFGLGVKGRVKRIVVNWPDGLATAETPEVGRSKLTLRHPRSSLGSRPLRASEPESVVGEDVWRRADAHFELGSSFRARGRHQAALKHFGQAVAIYPGHAEANLGMALALRQKGIDDEANEYLDRPLRINRASIEEDPDDAEAHYNLAYALAAHGKETEAVDHLRQALRLEPDHARAHRQLGTSFARTGQMAIALEHFREAARLRPDWPLPLKDMAFLVTSGSNVEGADAAEAIRFAERAVELTRQRDPDALDVLAAAYAMAGDFSRAVEAAEAALALTAATNDVQQSIYIRNHLEDYRRHLR